MVKHLFTALIVLMILSGCSDNITGTKDDKEPYAAEVTISDHHWYGDDMTITEIPYKIKNTGTEDINRITFTLKIVLYNFSNYSDEPDEIKYETVQVTLKRPLLPGVSYTDYVLILYAPFIKSITVENIKINQ